MLYQTHQDPLFVKKGNSFDFVPHAHHSIEIMLCTDGEYRVLCNFKEVILRRGEAMIAYSNDVHAYYQTPAAQGIVIIASPKLLSPFLNESLNRNFGNFCLKRDEELVHLGEALLEEYVHDADMNIMIGYLYVIYGKIRKHLPRHEAHSSVDAEQFSQILQYVSEHYTQKLSLKAISERFGISTCHLSRTFTQKLSCSFLRYLHILRVEHAKNLLRNSSMSILEIAYESGFSDQRTFNRVFKELTDRTPKDYRSSHKITN